MDDDEDFDDALLQDDFDQERQVIKMSSDEYDQQLTARQNQAQSQEAPGTPTAKNADAAEDNKKEEKKKKKGGGLFKKKK